MTVGVIRRISGCRARTCVDQSNTTIHNLKYSGSLTQTYDDNCQLSQYVNLTVLLLLLFCTKKLQKTYT